MKSSRQTLERHFAVPDSYHPFFSFPTGKGKTGYSGVAVYTTKNPLKAEEGLMSLIQPKPPLDPAERISTSYPQAYNLSEVLMLDEASNTSSDLTPLDTEGRSLVLDFGMFVLINVYCPNQTSDERLPFKMNFHHMLHERVRSLVEDEGREVIVIGDMNICASPLDHCDGHLPSNVLGFYEHHARAWFKAWLAPEGPMTDVVRSFWPDRKGMFTCTFTALVCTILISALHRLEPENICARFKLRYAGRLHSSHKRSRPLDQTRRYSTEPEGV
jgi:AP endonuclease-2